MKKLVIFFLAAMMLMISAAGAEETDLFRQMNGKVFEFSSGAGGWSTELTMGENGSFTGVYHDSEMGETGDNYPDGTVYLCSFHGQFTDPVQVDEYTWTVKVTTEADPEQEAETIEDGVRYVLSAPMGMEKAETVTIYLPGTPVEKLPEDFIFWTHLEETDPDAKVLPDFGIWNEADAAGFVTYSEVMEGAANEMISGGWTPAEDPTVTEELKALFDKGMSRLIGVKHEPVIYLGSQVVAGINHAFLCRSTVVYPDAKPFYTIVYLYEDLKGDVSVLSIADFDFGSLCSYGAAK